VSKPVLSSIIDLGLRDLGVAERRAHVVGLPGRGRAVAGVRALRSALAASGEPVRGDGVGRARRSGRHAVRVIAATDRRLLVADDSRVVLDVPYGAIVRWEVAWKALGQAGTLSLTAAGATHVIGSIVPANLLSIAQALRAAGVPTADPAPIDEAQRRWDRARRRAGSRRRGRGAWLLDRLRLIHVAATVIAGIALAASFVGFDVAAVPAAVQELTSEKLPVDGRSNLTGGAASLSYTAGDGLRELRTDQDWGEGPDDGARWELRSSFTKGYNVVSLSHYVFKPRLDDPAAVAAFVADKDREHARLAGDPVEHAERVVDGRKGYVWEHDGRGGEWHFAAWFPQPVHSVRLECIAKRQEARFKRLCAEAMASLRFHR
jgi:hypothetical protein